MRRLIAKGDTNGVPLAERAINEYWDAAPIQARESGLRFLQQDVLDQRNAVLGDLGIFVQHPKKTFATISALFGSGAMSCLSP
jgi:hypothetical protein